MKKKFLSFIFAICIMIPTVFFMTACGGDDPPPPPSVQSSKANVLNTDYTYNETEDCITLSITDAVNFQKSDFEIVQTFTDNTTKTLANDKWTLDLSEIPNPVTTGYYRIVFKYTEQNEEIDSINVTFVSSQINMIAFELQPYSTTYTGDEVDIVDMIDNYLTTQEQSLLSTLIDSGIVIVSSEQNSTRTATDSGEYTTKFTLADGYEWTESDSSAKYVNWTIDQVKIPAPTFVSNTLTYDYEVDNGELTGLEQEVEYTFGNFQNALDFVDINNNVQDARFATSATDAGYYFVRFDIKESCTQNYTFDFGTYTSNSFNLNWEIQPARVTIPSLKQTVFTYDPNGFDPMAETNLNNYNSAIITLTNYAGDIPQAGTYGNYIHAELKDPNNFSWDDTDGYQIQQLTFTVNKANVVLPNDFDESKLKMVTTWNPNLQLNYLIPTLQDSYSEYSNWTTEAREYMLNNGFKQSHSLLWASNVSNTDLAQAGAGTHTFKMLYTPNINYNSKELNVTVEILKERLSIVAYLNGNDSYSPEDRIYTAQSLDISLESMYNNVNVDNYATNVTYSVGYKETANGNYTYSDYTQEQFDSINGRVGSLMTNAGYYDLKVSVTADNNHLFYDQYAEGAETTATQICELHQPVVIHPHEVTMWLAFEHNLDKDYYNQSIYDKQKFYYKEGQSVSYTVTNFSDLADKSILIYTNLNTDTLVTNTMEQLPTLTTYYRANENADWTVATNTTDVGFYKNEYIFTAIDTKNIVVNPFELTWEIMSTNVNFNGIDFEDFTNPTYIGEDELPLPTIREADIPDSIVQSGYTYKTGTGYSNEIYGWQIMDAGDYLTSWWFKVPNNVTVTYQNETLPESLFTKTTEGDYTTYNYNILWSVEKHTLKEGEVTFDTYTNNQTITYTGEELSPVYDIVISEELGYDFRFQFTTNKTTKQNGETVTPISVGEYETTIVVDISKDNITLDETWKSTITGLTEDEYSYYITITINWSIVEANA